MTGGYPRSPYDGLTPRHVRAQIGRDAVEPLTKDELALHRMLADPEHYRVVAEFQLLCEACNQLPCECADGPAESEKR